MCDDKKCPSHNRVDFNSVDGMGLPFLITYVGEYVVSTQTAVDRTKTDTTGVLKMLLDLEIAIAMDDRKAIADIEARVPKVSQTFVAKVGDGTMGQVVPGPETVKKVSEVHTDLGYLEHVNIVDNLHDGETFGL